MVLVWGGVLVEEVEVTGVLLRFVGVDEGIELTLVIPLGYEPIFALLVLTAEATFGWVAALEGWVASVAMGLEDDTLELSGEPSRLIGPPKTPNPKSKRAASINSPIILPIIHPADPQNMWPGSSTAATLLSNLYSCFTTDFAFSLVNTGISDLGFAACYFSLLWRYSCPSVEFPFLLVMREGYSLGLAT